jgi:hypothetical protein
MFRHQLVAFRETAARKSALPKQLPKIYEQIVCW